MSTTRTSLVPSLLALGAAATALASDARVPESWRLYDRDREVELALSAAPIHLRDGAGVRVLTPDGFVRARESGNGFECVVQRVGRVQAPQCFDPEGARTTLPALLREMSLQLEGRSREEALEVVEREYRDGTLRAPGRPGIVYMLSREFVAFGEEGPRQVFAPHLMFYAPGLSYEDVGMPPEHHNDPRYPFLLNPGRPTAYVIVVPPDIDALIGPEEP